MSVAPKVLAFAGSARGGSFNKQLVRLAVRGVETAGVAYTLLDLRDYPLPLYDGDLEASDGLPQQAAELRRMFADHSGFLIAAPEYNGSISPLLKNTVDWVTRSPAGTPDLACFDGKLGALLSASPGPLGGMRGLGVLRSLLANVGVTVLAKQFSLRNASAAFSPDGGLNSEGDSRRLDAFVQQFASALRGWGD